MPGSGIDDLDLTLARLREAVTLHAAVLLEVEASPGRALLDPARLTGRSASLASDTLGHLVQAWRAFAALKDLLGRATELRGQRMDARRRAALDDLLHGYSVPEVLSSSRSRTRSRTRSLPPGHTSPEAPAVPARSPKTGNPMRPDGWVKPDVLARRLDHALREVAATVAWFSDTYSEHLAVLSRTQAEVGELAALARRLGEDDDRALALARRLLTETTAAAAADPVALPARTLAHLDAAVAAARSGLADLARRHDGLDEDLADAAALVAEIVRMVEAGRRDAERAQSRIPTPAGLLQLTDGWLDNPRRGLAPWLARLRAQAADGRWKEASRGLTNWRKVAEATRTTAAQVAVANAAALRRRDDVRGLFGAWEAKARRLGVADDPELAAAARRVRAVLFQAPASVTDGQRRIDSYARRLAALTGRSPSPHADPEPVGAMTGGGGATDPLPSPPAERPPAEASVTTTPPPPSRGR